MTEGVVQAAPAPSTPTVNIGDYIQFGKYNNAPILWRVIHKNPTTGEPILLADRILTLKAFDAKGNYHSGDTERVIYGSNYYPDSNIRQWLNSTSANSGSNLIDWLQNEPTKDNLFGANNAYHTEKGFLAHGNFTVNERALIKPYTHKVILHQADQAKKDGGTTHHAYTALYDLIVQNYDTTAYYKNVTDSVFLLSVKQLKEWVYDNSATLGADYQIAQPTAQAVTQSYHKDPQNLNSNISWFYYLNTPITFGPHRVRHVAKDGSVSDRMAYDDYTGVRPALQLNLNPATLTSGSGASSTPYIFEFQDTAPTDITLSKSTLRDDVTPGSWVGDLGSSGDPLAGDTATYTLVNGQGDADNDKFSISGTKLLTGAVFDSSVKNTANIRVRVTDSNNNTFEKALVLSVADILQYVRASGTSKTTFAAAGTAIDSGLTIVTNLSGITSSTSISGATVLVENPKTGDSLSYTGSLPSGVTASAYNGTTGLLRFNGSTTPANWQTLLRTVKFTTSSVENESRAIKFTIGSALPLLQTDFSTNYYEVVNTKTGWNAAKTAAEARKAANVINGYLATTQTQAQYDFLRKQFSVDGWLGGSDEFATINAATGKTTTTGFANQTASEGKFFWVTGPASERVQFSQGNSPNNTVLPGFYAKWNTAVSDPNNSGGEHYIESMSNGMQDRKENDWTFVGDYTTPNYFVEYSGGTISLTASILLDKMHPVTFQTNGGSAVADQLVNHNTLAEAPISPTREGYSFLGWYANSDFSGGPFVFTTPITSATTLYAKWNTIPVGLHLQTKSINIGDYIRFGKYNNMPILWRVIHVDATTGNPILLANTILMSKAFDARGSYHTGNDNRTSFGSNYYADSNIRQWLNSSSANTGTDSIDWIQNDPIATNSAKGWNPYNTEKGFLAPGNFTVNERGLIIPYTHKVLLSSFDEAKKDGGTENYVRDATGAIAVNNYDSTAFYQYVTDNVFHLSVKQLKEWVVDNNAILGANYHIAMHGPSQWYWLNTPNPSESKSVLTVQSSGTLASYDAYNDFIGIRPALQLNMAAAPFTSGSGTSNNPLVVGETPPPVTIAENAGAGTVIGTLHAVDADSDESFTYVLVDGVGSTDNASFTIDGNKLKTAVSFDHETKSSASIRVRVSDSAGTTYEKSLTLSITNVNEAPTNVSLSPDSIAEVINGLVVFYQTVGTLSASDPDAGDTFTYSLVGGEGSTNNASFMINNNGTPHIGTTSTFDYETKSSYSIRVRVTDKLGLTFEKVLTVYVTDVPEGATNQAPTNITLSASSIAENVGANAVVGTLSSTDPNAGDSATFTLVSGAGSTDNAAFNISGSNLRANASFDFETKTSYSVRVRVTDSGGLTFEKTFAISVTDVDDTAPSAPSGLNSSNVTATSASISWSAATDNVGVTKYEVYNGIALVGTTTGATTFNLTGLVSGSTNSITVVAVDAANNKSAASAALTVMLLDVIAPSIPSGLASSNVTQSGFTVTWTASTDNRAVRSYNVYRNGAYVANVSTNSYKFNGLTALTLHSIRVLAIDAAGNRSAQSAVLAVTTSAPADVTVPSTPGGLTATSVLSNRILLTWTPSTDNVGVTGYNVYVNNVYLKTVTAAQTDLTGLTPLTSYSIQVQALDAAKNRSARSTALSVTTGAPPDTTAPTVPSNLTLSNLTGTSVNLRWDGSTDNVGVTGYNVYVNGVYKRTSTTSATTITNLSSMTTYAITVLAFDAASNRSANSTAVSFTTLDGQAPSAPTNVASTNVTKTGTRVTWTAATDNLGVTSYNIYRNGTYVATVSGTTTAYNLSGLTAGTTYNITVRALDAAKNFTNSAALSVTTLP